MSTQLLAPSVRVWLRRVRAMTVKELLQLARDPVLLFVILYGFTADVYNAGSGVTLQLRNAAVAVEDHDRTATSRELTGKLMPPQFKLAYEVTRPEQGQALLDDGEALMLLTFPSGFERDLAAGRPTGVQLQIDATNSVLGLLAYSYTTQIVSDYGLETVASRMGLSASPQQMPIVDNRDRVWFNPNQNDRWFMSISELLNVITAFAILLPAAIMVREKERGTIEQLMVSPLTPLQITIPKIIAMLVVIHSGILISIVCVLEPVFGVPLKGSLALFFLITTMYVVTLAGLGLAIATVTRNLAQAAMLGILVLAPMIFLSGVWTPPEAMPAVVRPLMYFSPLYYYMEASYGVLLKGAGVRELSGAILGILALGSLNGGLGLWRFRRQFG
ncbi:MAG TPA: ABC transporter permease [Steroidobacteraceae bacterium]|nr:ABC transporter permease [Steroidobacteraceae bacterium]